MNLYRAIDNNVGTLQHFITHEWHWDSTQYNKILSAIKEEDREVVKILTTNVLRHIETSQLICRANQLTGFYMMENIGR